jgi:hypothetical protein
MTDVELELDLYSMHDLYPTTFQFLCIMSS